MKNNDKGYKKKNVAKEYKRMISTKNAKNKINEIKKNKKKNTNSKMKNRYVKKKNTSSVTELPQRNNQKQKPTDAKGYKTIPLPVELPLLIEPSFRHKLLSLFPMPGVEVNVREGGRDDGALGMPISEMQNCCEFRCTLSKMK